MYWRASESLPFFVGKIVLTVGLLLNMALLVVAVSLGAGIAGYHYWWQDEPAPPRSSEGLDDESEFVIVPTMRKEKPKDLLTEIKGSKRLLKRVQTFNTPWHDPLLCAIQSLVLRPIQRCAKKPINEENTFAKQLAIQKMQLRPVVKA